MALPQQPSLTLPRLWRRTSSPTAPIPFNSTATNTGGNSDSVTAAATTLKWPPATPTDLLAAANSQTQVQLSWTDNADNEEGYQMKYAPKQPGQVVATSQNLRPIPHRLQRRILRQLQPTFSPVRAYNNGGFNEVVSSVTTLPWPPAAPDNLTINVLSQTEVEITWQDNADNETAYILEKCTGPSDCTLIVNTAANTTSYTVTGLLANTTYGFRLTATNTGGNLIQLPLRPPPQMATGYSNRPAGRSQQSNSSAAFVDRQRR